MRLTTKLKNVTVSVQAIYIIYIASFLVATGTHTYDVLTGGFLPYKQQPLWANIYWTSLTLLDPLAILLLFLDINAGLIVYCLVITSDVCINTCFALKSGGFAGLFHLFLICQAGFMLFLMLTIKKTWIGRDKDEKEGE